MRKLKTLYNQQTTAAAFPIPPGTTGNYSSAVPDYAGADKNVPPYTSGNHTSATFLLHPGFMDEDKPAEPYQFNIISLNEMVLLTVDQAVNRYNIGKNAVRSMAITAGAVVRIGRRTLIHRETMDNYLEGLRE